MRRSKGPHLLRDACARDTRLYRLGPWIPVAIVIVLDICLRLAGVGR